MLPDKLFLRKNIPLHTFPKGFILHKKGERNEKNAEEISL